MSLAVAFGATLLALLEIPYPWIDPVALDLPGPIDLRWYGLSYLLAFATAYFILRWLAREGFLKVDPDTVGDLIFAVILGAVLGGRIGYILFYDFAEFAANPTRIIRIWEGGLSFHGGLIGVLTAGWLFTRKHGISFLHLGDAMALAIPFGLFYGRIANFINGELYGREASANVPWAMRFPTDPAAQAMLGIQQTGMRTRELAIEQAYESGAWEAVRDRVPLRHPSQLYEAFGEGLLLALILWALFFWARRRGVRLSTGTYSGIFLAGYGIVRSIVELFRQPDAQFRGPDDPVGTVLGPLTMGQTLSLVMILAGLWLLVRAWTRRGAAPEAAAPRRG